MVGTNLKQGGTNGSKEKSSKEEGSKEEGSKEEGSKEEGSKEEGSKEEGSKEESSKEENSKEESSKEEKEISFTICCFSCKTSWFFALLGALKIMRFCFSSAGYN
jgi:hypothetical protein